MPPRPPKAPADIARRLAAASARSRGDEADRAEDGWRRQTFRLPREAARQTAREWFERYPKAAYMTKVESWRALDNGLIEFTMRRLPSAD